MITIADVVSKVRELAAESPEYVYKASAGEQCVNYEMDDEGNPIPMSGCIVGQALDALGVDMISIRPGGSAPVALYYAGIEFEEVDASWLIKVQIAQDGRVKWSDAVARADAVGRADF